MHNGVPRPYSVGTDDALTILLIVAVVLFVVVMATSKRAVVQQAKRFFFSTSAEDRDVQWRPPLFVAVLIVLNGAMLSVGSFLYATDDAAGDATGRLAIGLAPIVVVGIYFLLFTLYYGVKWLVNSFVNSVLFDGKKCLHWNQSLYFLTAMEGMLTLPIVLAMVYLHLSVENVLYPLFFVLFLNKILTFFKSYNIFFRQNHFIFQNILYFCALEIMPLIALGGIWLMTTQALKINF